MRLSDVKTQDSAVRVLKSTSAGTSVAHAYLFAGPNNTGKTSAALAFASALNCAAPTDDGDACGTCMSCLRIEAGTDPDVQLISPQRNATTIKQTRDMIRDMSYAPLSGRYRIFIIEQADTLNPFSENSILKALEEPPSYVVLILIAANANSLLPTIRSRCLMVRFRRSGTEEVADALRELTDLDGEDIRTIAACSRGALGNALRMASEPGFREERQAVLEALRTWSEGPAVLSIRTAEIVRRLAEPKKNDPDERTRIRRLAEILEHILYWHSDLLALKVCGGDAHLVNVDYADVLAQQAGRYDAAALREGIRSIMETRRYLEGNVNPQLALENMFFALRPERS